MGPARLRKRRSIQPWRGLTGVAFDLQAGNIIRNVFILIDKVMELAPIQVEIVTPEGVMRRTQASLIEFPSADGELGILAGHAPLVSDLAVGQLRIFARDNLERFAVAGGFVEVLPGRVRILAVFASAETESVAIEDACVRARAALETAAGQSPAQIAAEMVSLKGEFARLAQLRKPRRSR